MQTVSIVIPVYYNQNNLLNTYHKIINEVLSKADINYEFIFVDDGSGDGSYSELLNLHKLDSRVKVIKLSRNFGQHTAILCGLSHISGDCAVVISADLQDPPELISQMYQKYLDGNKVVLAIRTERNEPLFQKMFSRLYHKLMQRYAIKDMPVHGFDCFLADKSVVKVLVSIEEKNTSLFALILWVGFKRSYVNYTRKAREIGNSRWTFSKKIKLFIDSFLAFSYVPIRLISMIGIIDCFFSLLYIGYLIAHYFISKQALTGWSSLMVAIMFTSGVQMLTLGVIGEYLWRNFDESRKRPLYIIDEKHGI